MVKPVAIGDGSADPLSKDIVEPFLLRSTTGTGLQLDLTYDEVLIVDPETPITREDYEFLALR